MARAMPSDEVGRSGLAIVALAEQPVAIDDVMADADHPCGDAIVWHFPLRRCAEGEHGEVAAELVQ